MSDWINTKDNMPPEDVITLLVAMDVFLLGGIVNNLMIGMTFKAQKRFLLRYPIGCLYRH